MRLYSFRIHSERLQSYFFNSVIPHLSSLIPICLCMDKHLLFICKTLNPYLYFPSLETCEHTMYLKFSYGPGWCGSLDWVPACKPEGCWSDSQSGQVPGLQLGVHRRPPHICVFLPLFLRLFLPPFSCLWK